MTITFSTEKFTDLLAQPKRSGILASLITLFLIRFLLIMHYRGEVYDFGIKKVTDTVLAPGSWVKIIDVPVGYFILELIIAFFAIYFIQNRSKFFLYLSQFVCFATSISYFLLGLGIHQEWLSDGDFFTGINAVEYSRDYAYIQAGIFLVAGLMLLAYQKYTFGKSK